MKLSWYGDTILQSLFNVYEENKYLTRDVGGNSTTSDFTNRICEEVNNLMQRKQ